LPPLFVNRLSVQTNSQNAGTYVNPIGDSIFVANPSKIEHAYTQINEAVSIVMTELGMVA